MGTNQKFQVTFKDPDCLVTGTGKDIDYVDQLPTPARDLTKKFLEFDEYVTIEFDTTEGTAVVVPQ